MKTFTICAEKKAKQFFNPLQGYTKGIRITAILILLLMGVSNAWAATQRYIYVGISNNYQNHKDGNNFGLNVWGGTDGGVKSLTWIQDNYNWDGRNYTIYRAQVYDDNNKAQFKGNDNWWDPGDGFSVKLNGTTNNAIFFSHSNDGWSGQFQQNYQQTSTAKLTASSTSVTTGTNVTLTPSLSSNTTYNQIKSTTYTVSTNPNSGGSVTSAGVFSATKAGTYTVTATVTYNPKYFTGITKTATATQTIKVYDTQYVLRGSQTANGDPKGGMAGWEATNNDAYTSATINGTTMTIVATLTNAKTQYKFKIYNNFDGSYYGQTGSAEIPNNTSWTLNGSNDVKFTTTAAGSYTFIYNTSNKSIKIQYPTAYTVTYSRVPTAAANAPTTTPSFSSGDYVLANTSVTFNAKTANTGYTWKGWYDNNAGTGTALSSNQSYTRSITANTTIYACYDLDTYNITYNLNGGSGTMTPTSYTITTTTFNLPAPTKTGHTFAGWYTTSDFSGNKVTQITKGSTGHKEFWAKWTPNTYTITYKDQGGSNFSGTHESEYPTTHTYGTATTLKNASKTGYTFEGWYKESACTNKVTSLGATEYTANITLYAKWTANANTHYITYTTEETGWTYGTTPTSAEEGAIVTFVVNPTTGYNVNVASSDATITGPNASNEYSFTMPNKDVTINVSATEKLTTVTLNVSSGSGSFTVDDTSYTSGSTVKVGVATSYIVKAIANTGYTFDKWTQGGNASAKGSGNSVTLKGNGNGETGSLNAYFNRTYAFIQGRFRVNSASRNQMTYTYNDGGQWKEDGTNIQMEYDDTNSRFYLHTYMKPKELTENHGTGCQDCKPYFYIKTSTSSSSLVNTISYQSTTSQTLTTAGISGKKGLATSGGSNANLRFDTQDESGYVVLYFDEQYIWYELEYRLDYNANGGTGTAPSRTYHFSGTNITAKPANTFTREGYTFTGWNTAEDGSGTSYAAGASVTINKNTTLYAQWEENTFAVTINANGNGTVNPNGEQEVGVEGLEVEAKPADGYQLTEWTTTGGAHVANSTNTTTTITATAAGTVTANFSAIIYTITYNLDGGTNHADNPAKYTIETPTITLQAPTRTGYSFAGWYTTNKFSGDPITEITQSSTGDKTFYAKWIEQKEIYLVGEFGWENPTEEYKFKAHQTKPGVYTLTRPFEKRDRYDMTDQNGPGQPEYEFKLQVNGTKYTVKTENGKKILQYTRQSKTKVLSDGNNYNSDPYYNLLLQADISGDYVFEYNVESQELTVEHPAYQSEASYIVGDFSDGQTGTDALPKDGGAGYDWTEEKGIKFNNDNTAVICFNGTGKKWEFKIKINGIWYGAEGLVIEADGTYTLSNTYAFQSETNCAIQTSGVNGCYTFSYTEKGNGEIELTVGFPKQSENPTTVYLKPNDAWKEENARFAVHYWQADKPVGWVDMTDVGCNGDYYQADIPAGYSNIMFVQMQPDTENDWNNKGNHQTGNLTVPTNGNNLYDVDNKTLSYLHLKPNANWKQSNARFAAYFFGNGETWVSMEQDRDDYYTCEIPTNKKYPNVILCRMNPSTTANNWNNKWDQTNDLTIPTNGNNLYTVKDGAWSNGDGTWSRFLDNSQWTTYTEPTYDVTINITGKGAIVIDGQTYEGTSEGTTTITIEDLRVNTNINVTSIEPAERWAYKDDNATIQIGTGDNESLVANSTYLICAPTTITAEFTQTLCEVIFELNLDEGVEYPEPVNSQYITPGDTVVKPHIVHINGYMFDGWYKEPTCKNKYTFSTPVNKDMTLYAKWAPYSECIFFKNNLNWDNIYVYTFSNNVWHNGDNQENPNDDKGVQPQENRIEYGKMTQIGYTDIYYYALTNLKGFNHIAFSDHDMHDYDDYFHNHSGIYRSDRQDHMSLFIPQREQTPDYRNETAYYNSGLWMKYNSTESGYKWSSDKNAWNTNINPFTAPMPGGYSFSVKVALNGGTPYKFKVNNINGDWYGEKDTMTKEHCTDLWLPYNMETEYNTTIQPNVTGEYIFTIYLGDGKVMISLEYPLDVNDYRLAYNDNTTGFHPGHYIRKRLAEEQLDTVSFFVHKDYSPQVLLQKCISINVEEGTAEWATIGEPHPVNVASTSVYNFVLQQTGTTEAEHKAEVQMDKTHPYVGNYYIRTNDAPGGWDYFRQEDNMIHFSSYASDHENFTHYFCKWVKSNDKEGYSNVAFTIANDYSYCISDTMDNDEIIKQGQTAQGYLPEDANVRFSWNNKDNSINRAYIAGSSWVRDRFLVLQGNNQLFDVEGNALPEGVENTIRDGLHENEVIFTDMGNWIYQVDVQANKDTEVRLTALYNNVVQYFKGSEKEPTALLRSTEGKNYKIRLIYDFKINKLISAWLAGGETIEGQDQTLGADMMIIRHNQEKAEQLNFDPTSRKLSDVRTAYAVMTFDKYFLNNRAEDGSHLTDSDKQSPYARALYWISFPFDVKLSEVFGFGEYGDYWIMEYYDGEARAKNGLWADTDTYWKYITNKNYILQKGQGYVISLNLNKMGFESNIFDNTDEVSLYFPSHGELDTITGELPTNVIVPAHECTIEREKGIHKIYDSHWNVIGVPGFADIENVEVGNHLFVQDSLYFYYEYLPQANEYRTKRANNKADFQTMYSYMIQYHGGINWSTKTFNGPAEIAARRTGDMPSQYDLRLELAIDDQLHDQTFVLLDEDKRATAEYDVNLDLTKIMNKNASIYTLAGEQRITLSGNTLPMEKTTVPVGVRVDAAGEYTFRMPDGTDGISVFLIDNQTGAQTNMLLDEYTVTLDAGTCENRFYLAVDPDRTATSVENIGEEAKGEEAKDQIKKFLIDGQLFIRTADGTFDAKGQRL